MIRTSDLRKWLQDWAKTNARKGFRRAWADLRAAGWAINKKKVQRLWREERLRVKARKIRKRARRRLDHPDHRSGRAEGGVGE